MKKPDEIKKGLECCMASYADCHRECPYKADCDGSQILKDALALIQQLESENKQYHQENTEMYAEMCMLREKVHRLEAERDAVMRDMSKNCFSCKNAGFNNPGSDGCPYVEQCQNYVKWQWRGVQKEE